MPIFLFLLVIVSSFESRADIFVPGPADNAALQETLALDRSGYYLYSSGLDVRSTEKKVSDTDSFPSGALTRDRGLYNVEESFQKEFDASFSRPGSFDRYRAARNSLLLLEYSSPALADVIKHYRSLTAQRIVLEQERLANIEKASEGPLDRLRMSSELECLRERQGEGLVAAMEKCKNSDQPFDALPLLNGQGSLADGRRNIHVVRDAVSMLGLSEKGAGERAALLSGDVVVSDDSYVEMLAKETFESRTEYHRKKFFQKWQEALKAKDGRKTGLSELSLPGVPVTETLIRNLMLFDEVSRGVAVTKLAAYLARSEAFREFKEARAFLEYAQRLPRLPREFRTILRARSDFLSSIISRAGEWNGVSEGYRAMLAGLLTDADTVRDGLLAGEKKDVSTQSSVETLMAVFN